MQLVIKAQDGHSRDTVATFQSVCVFSNTSNNKDNRKEVWVVIR
jgi:hypothetical protein